MYLQKLEIQGFKSFAPKTTFIFPSAEGDSKGITAVIGPNGSGKSNVADAIRWVLGEQSMKLLRSKRSEDVIFFGSDKKGQLGFCEVSLFFNNEDKTFPVDYVEVVLTRRLYRSGESEYYINKNKVRLQDVTLLIAQAHIGQRSYSVIGQGMIDSIINTPPADRKEFFDEAAGVRQYQIKKDSALSKIRSTRENLTQAQGLLIELEPKIKFFQRQLKRLEERGEIEKELQGLLRQYYSALWQDVCERITDSVSKRGEVQKDIDKKSEEYIILQKEFGDLESEGKKRDTAGFAGLQQEHTAKNAERNKLLGQRSVLEGRLQLAFENAGQARSALLQSKKIDLTQRLEEVATQKEQCGTDTGARVAREAELMGAIQDLEKKLQECEDLLSRELTPHDAVTTETILVELRTIAGILIQNSASPDQLTSLIKTTAHQLTSLIATIEGSLVHDTSKSTDIRKNLSAVRAQKEQLAVELQRTRIDLGVVKHRVQELEIAFMRHTQELAQIEKDLVLAASGTTEEQQLALQGERDGVDARLATLTDEVGVLSKTLAHFYESEQVAHTQLLTLQKRMAATQRELEGIRERAVSHDVELAKRETHQEELLHKIIEELAVDADTQARLLSSTESVASLLGFAREESVGDRQGMRETIDRHKRKLEQIGTIDQEIVSEYEATKERYEFLSTQVTDLTEAITSLQGAIQDLDGIIRQKFDVALKNINAKFEHYFHLLFNGGTAHLIVQRREREEHADEESAGTPVVDQDEIAGIEIEATPPCKKFKNISFLSGGEKALTAVALICAILATNPSPFVVLDEVDAALDESNANRLADILQELAERTQFIVITHNRVTMHIGSVLYGITMGDDGISTALSLDIRTIGATIANT